ncbi:NfeD family protein [Cellulosimicrobium marinum]|uniref:NfeD family protein n=1 Tax=Cellulosimicrobium marinum TaxID=1638992 RepID=UPI001E5C1A5D|nr:NfeD family protein [Cellulosimicrobium marinum]MCB7135012.1 NfeD family protein [Cellulosimicrobium marinum]
MIAFIVIGIAGLALLLLSLLVGEIVDLGDGALSGTSLGVGGVVFGAVGVIVSANDLPTWIAYVGSFVVALAVVLVVQRLVQHLRDSESGVPGSLVGVQGTATTAIDPSTGEVSLDAAHELERRLAWSDEPIPEGARVVVLEQSGSRVRVRRHFTND